MVLVTITTIIGRVGVDNEKRDVTNEGAWEFSMVELKCSKLFFDHLISFSLCGKISATNGSK